MFCVRFTPTRFSKLAISAAISALLLSGCNDNDNISTIESVTVTVTDVVTQNAKMAHAVYADTVSTAQSLKDAIDTFVAKTAPSDVDLSELKTLWIASREPYGLSEIWRFREGPIDALKDDGTMGAEGDGPEGRINAWPLSEALIDWLRVRWMVMMAQAMRRLIRVLAATSLPTAPVCRRLIKRCWRV